MLWRLSAGRYLLKVSLRPVNVLEEMTWGVNYSGPTPGWRKSCSDFVRTRLDEGYSLKDIWSRGVRTAFELQQTFILDIDVAKARQRSGPVILTAQVYEQREYRDGLGTDVPAGQPFETVVSETDTIQLTFRVER